MDGTAQINMYELKEMPAPEQNAPIDTSNFITRMEFEETMNQVKNYLESFVSASRESAAANTQMNQEPNPQKKERSFDF